MKFALTVLLGTVGFAAAQPADSPKPKTPGTAQIRFLAAVAGEAPVDGYLRGKKVWEGAAFGALGDYQTTVSGKTSLKVLRPAETSPFVQGATTLARDGHYTAIAFGDKAKPAVIFQNDDAGPADPRRARIRVFHVAPGLDTIALTTPSTRAQDGATTLIKELDYGKDSTRLIEPGKLTLQLRAAGKLLKEKADVTLEAGQRYAVFVLGQGETLDMLLRPMAK